MRRSKKEAKKKGFTLVELLVAMAVSSLLLVFVSFSSVYVVKTNRQNLEDSRVEYQIKSLLNLAKRNPSYVFYGGKENKEDTRVCYKNDKEEPSVLFENDNGVFLSVDTIQKDIELKELRISYLFSGKTKDISMLY